MNSESLHTNYEPAQEAIALLIDMAKRGEIDPWDVQVIDVIDRCLDALAEYSKTHSGTFEADLSQSGQAFLYASMLVLLKADTLFNYSSVEAEPEVIDIESENLEGGEGGELPPYLERHLRRRPTAQPLQKRPVTLQDLISQLQQIAAELETKAPRVRPKRVSSQLNKQTAQAIADLAHQENLTETASELELFLQNHWAQMSLGQDWLALEELIQLWTKVTTGDSEHSAEIDASNHQVSERVGVFWALLLLSAQSKVELSQEEFYQDLKIRILGDEQFCEVCSAENGTSSQEILPKK